MKQKTVLITGGNGAIGQALCVGFLQSGWRVIATDKEMDSVIKVDGYVSIELKQFCDDEKYHDDVITLLRMKLKGSNLHALINNAAIQILASVEALSVEDLRRSLDINLVAPFLLIKDLLNELEASKGSIINIASIHAQLTKPKFMAYATSKAALVGLTRSLAVELGGKIRGNAICPAAIATSMLKQGLNNDVEKLNSLKNFHPSKCIGETKDVVDAARYLTEVEGDFLTGTVITLDGGISSRLHE
jgi:NAD(P)-dependent dehydrogenase (short-subunit alcohol dehydrogenase family)